VDRTGKSGKEPPRKREIKVIREPQSKSGVGRGQAFERGIIETSGEKKKKRINSTSWDRN